MVSGCGFGLIQALLQTHIDEPMTCFGSKALQSGRLKAHHHNSVGDSQMGVQEVISNSHQGEDGRKKRQNRRPRKEHNSSSSLRLPDNFAKAQKSSKHHNTSISLQPSVLRKQVDPETTKYFSEIANIFEGSGVDLEERSVICGNALEETRGKELELATDYIISHTLQALLEGSDVDQLCGFLQSCAEDFPHIAMDRSGSHVAETALRSLTVHLQEKEAHAIIEETLTKLCQVIAVKSVNVMCSRYGSHVLRSLLCLCKGIPLDSAQEFHVTKSSAILAERCNTRETKSVGNNPQNLQQGFPDLLKFLVMEMLKCAWEDIGTLQVNQYSSLVLQTALKVLVGEDQELMHIIPILLGCHGESDGEGSLLQTVTVKETMELLNDNAFSHLMEVILEVAPETLYNEMLNKMFRNMLFEISSHHYGSFVTQALVSSATRQDQMDLVWMELGGKFKELLEIGRTGVIASILAASQRLHTHEQKFSEALAAAVCSATESISCIVPRILFLESYFVCGDKASWKWEKGDKMHVLGCLMLQTVFRYPTEFIQPYIKSLISMEADLVLEAVKDARAGRVIESFLSSKASTKHKHKLIVKLRGHFGELSMRPSGSFTVEKCFTASNASLRVTIASELLAVRAELSKTKQGPHLLRKLDVDGFATQPGQWKSRQESKQAAYKEFYAAFGPSKTKSNETFSAEPSSRCSPPKSVKKMRKEIDQYLATPSTLGSNFLGLDASMAKLGFRGFKRRPVSAEEWGSKKFAKLDVDGGDGLKWEKKDWRKIRKGC